eukprot:TRINITY_DN45700_c0_g1_i1.p1 TRINITY_DN45700_c0_g1~~TRINITY_DN45700_c0_g1_i1.p1  ORF type:complete len:156 (+),score=18.33 TRINITY_DN45700_c0_g1_i1:65-532(+)
MPWPWSMWLSACILWWRNLRIAVGAEAIDMAMFQEPQLVNVKTEDGRHVMAAVGGGWSHVRLIEAHPLGWPCMKRAQVLEQQHGWFDKGLSLSSQKILYEEMAEWARMHFDGEAPGRKFSMTFGFVFLRVQTLRCSSYFTVGPCRGSDVGSLSVF